MSRVERALTAGQLRIRSQRRGSVHEVALAGELDVATAEAVQHELTAVEATHADQIIIDLAGLDFIASTGLQLIALSRSRADTGREPGRSLPGRRRRPPHPPPAVVAASPCLIGRC